MLSDAQADELKSALLRDRDRILTSAKGAKAFSMDRDKTRIGGDSIDLSAAEALYGTELRLADRENYLLNTIMKSLQRLEEGFHGVCQDCEEPIAWPRMKARPVTILCVDCQSDQEQQLKHEE